MQLEGEGAQFCAQNRRFLVSTMAHDPPVEIGRRSRCAVCTVCDSVRSFVGIGMATFVWIRWNGHPTAFSSEFCMNLSREHGQKPESRGPCWTKTDRFRSGRLCLVRFGLLGYPGALACSCSRCLNLPERRPFGTGACCFAE